MTHDVPAYLDEEYPVTIEVTNADDRTLEVVADILLQPSEIEGAGQLHFTLIHAFARANVSRSIIVCSTQHKLRPRRVDKPPQRRILRDSCAWRVRAQDPLLAQLRCGGRQSHRHLRSVAQHSLTSPIILCITIDFPSTITKEPKRKRRRHRRDAAHARSPDRRAHRRYLARDV